MLPRNQRLTAEKDYAQIFSKGRSWNGRGLSIKALKNTLGYTRVGFVVSTKVAKKAVIRNRIKRRMRDALRKRMAALFKGVDIAFIARPEAKEMDYADIVNSINDVLMRAGILPRS